MYIAYMAYCIICVQNIFNNLYSMCTHIGEANIAIALVNAYLKCRVNYNS